MGEENRKKHTHGRYLTNAGPGGGAIFRWMRVVILLSWNGMLLYMIADCLIAPVYGAAFIGMISVYLGYQL